MVESMRVAVAQLCSKPSPGENLEVCERLVVEAARLGADWVAFPENAPHLGPARSNLGVAEALDGPVVSAFAEMARASGVAVLLGSTAEAGPDPSRAYNTSVLLGRQGQILGVYRKIHLFDVELPSGQRLWESESVAAGEALTVAELEGFGVGMSVCYDLRFPELYRALRRRGAHVLAIPSAFTERTGRDHWEVLLRARAIENQCYVVAPGQWGEHLQGRQSYGRSMIIDPWGTVLATAPDGVGVALARIEVSQVEEVRRRMPCLSHARLLTGEEG